MYDTAALDDCVFDDFAFFATLRGISVQSLTDFNSAIEPKLVELTLE
jgi:hypothetical protein